MNAISKSCPIVAIARAMGSGGGFVGKELAKRLGCLYLDREILVEAARRMNQDPEALEAYDERHLTFWERARLAYAFGAPDAPYAPPPVSIDDQGLFDVEKAIIREAAARGPAVILGRAAFEVLAGEPGLVSVFLHAPLEHRVKRVMRLYGFATDAEARELVIRTDRDRGQFVKAVSGKERLDPQNYHLCLDTSRFGIPAVVELVYQAAMSVEQGLSQPGPEGP